MNHVSGVRSSAACTFRKSTADVVVTKYKRFVLDDRGTDLSAVLVLLQLVNMCARLSRRCCVITPLPCRAA
jgi:hypothetical protein